MNFKPSFLILTLFICYTYQTGVNKETEKENSIAHIGVQYEEVADKMNDFSYRLLLECMKLESNKNVVLGPSTIAAVMSVLLLGTVGKSYDELATALGFSQDIFKNRNHHKEFGKLLQKLNNNSTSTITLFSNTVFVDSKSQLRPIFEDYAKRVYNTSVQKNDFSDPERTVTTINNWVKEQTNGKITNLIENSLPIETKLVVLSTHYFNGQWAFPFTPKYTQEIPFHKLSGESILADLMLSHGIFKYHISHAHKCHIVGMPYKDNSNYMYVIMPYGRRRSDYTIKELLRNFNWADINSLINKTFEQNVMVRFPKMKLAYNRDIKNSLINLGVQSIFSLEKANFALMLDESPKSKRRSEEELLTRIKDGLNSNGENVRNLLDGLTNPNVHVDKVIHNVLINVDEFGTEAVSATAGLIARSVPIFLADSPFLMFIRNEETRLVTFSAVVNDPTE